MKPNPSMYCLQRAHITYKKGQKYDKPSNAIRNLINYINIKITLMKIVLLRDRVGHPVILKVFINIKKEDSMHTILRR